MLTFWLTKMRETLGPDDPLVKKMLGMKSPAALAAELVDGSALASVDVRNACSNGDEAAIAASTDPMIALRAHARSGFRAVRKDYEDNVEAPLSKYRRTDRQRAISRSMAASSYPDATFTLRISFGAVKGYAQGGRDYRADHHDRRRLRARHRLRSVPAAGQLACRAIDAQSSPPFNFATTNDIIGGNSGSPVVNKGCEVVGLIFDGNIQSLGGDFGYDAAVNRAVAVERRRAARGAVENLSGGPLARGAIAIGEQPHAAAVTSSMQPPRVRPTGWRSPARAR